MLHNQINHALPVAETALFLDLDGAIVPIAAEPDQVRASPSCRIVLHRARDHLRGRLAIVSGRTIEDVDEVLGGAIPCVAGVHGLQRRTPVGGLVLVPPHARVADAASVLEALARARPGLLVEAKGPSVAIHYRAAPEAGPACLAAAEAAAQAASGYVMQAGKMVVEVKPAGAHKGTALHRLMSAPPFAGRRAVMLGDDVTDEDAMGAALALGGTAVKVGVGASVAPLRAPDPEGVRAWLVQEANLAGRTAG